MRRRRGLPALPCLALVAAGVVAGGAVRLDASAGSPFPEQAVVVDVQLSTALQLSATARDVLIAEVDAIWRQAGVRLRWGGAGQSAPPPDAALRVLVVPNDRIPRDRGHEWHVGRLVAGQGDDAVAIASIAAAERALDALTTFNEPARLRERRLGLILGRAVAHELGHFLLNSGSHGPRGLMRASINARDLADLRSRGFFLDAAATAWIRTRSMKAAAVDAGPPRRFAYAP